MKKANELEQSVRNSIEASIATKQSLLKSPELLFTVAKVSELLARALLEGNKVFFFGNGGSAADAQHIAAEFVGRFALERPALPALALSVNTSCVTAIGNDYGFDQVFSRQLEALARPGDIAVGISTSGKSPNVALALAVAKTMKLRTVALTGRTGGTLLGNVEYCICIRGPRSGQIAGPEREGATKAWHPPPIEQPVPCQSTREWMLVTR